MPLYQFTMVRDPHATIGDEVDLGDDLRGEVVELTEAVMVVQFFVQFAPREPELDMDFPGHQIKRRASWT